MAGKAYDFDEFRKECESNPANIIVFAGAREGAMNDFGLDSGNRIKGFIASGGLEDLVLRNTRPWTNNPKPENRIMVDSYTFKAGKKGGYIAIMKSSKGDKWVIKSFKKDDNFVEPINSPFSSLGSLSALSPKGAQKKGDDYE